MQSEFGRFTDAAITTWNIIPRRVCGWKRIVVLSAFLFLVDAFAHLAAAQNYLTSTGSPSFSAPEPVELGFVDASNGDLHLSIPLGSYPQRGGSQPLPITLEYDSNIWTPYDNGGTVQWEPTNGPGSHSLAGWYFSYEATWQAISEVVQNCWPIFTGRTRMEPLTRFM